MSEPKYLVRCMSSKKIGERGTPSPKSRREVKTVSLMADAIEATLNHGRKPLKKRRGERRERVHIFLKPKDKRDGTNWSNLLRAAVYDSFDEAMHDARSASIEAFQIVPVGYVGPPYWESRAHVRWQGSMAKYRAPRVFLIDTVTGEQIEV